MQGLKVVCKYTKIREQYNITVNKIYDVIDIKIYGAFPTYVIIDDLGVKKEITSLLFLELQRDREIKLEKLLD